MNEQRYSYTILRYIHDMVSGERFNVGIVLYAPDAKFLGAKTRPAHGRIKKAFPNLDSKAFKSAIKGVEAAIAKKAQSGATSDIFSSDLSASTFAESVLPKDDSSLQWSDIRIGICSDPKLTLDQLFHRMVTKYDERQEHGRTDDDVWRPIQQEISARAISVPFEEKLITGTNDEITFQHAWKNGEWHCYEPLSMDLSDPENIKNKARKWRGHLSGLEDAKEHFKTYFVVGKPSRNDLLPAYETALKILGSSLNAEVFEEHQASKLVDKIASKVASHNS